MSISYCSVRADRLGGLAKNLPKRSTKWMRWEIGKIFIGVLCAYLSVSFGGTRIWRISVDNPSSSSRKAPQGIEEETLKDQT